MEQERPSVCVEEHLLEGFSFTQLNLTVSNEHTQGIEVTTSAHVHTVRRDVWEEEEKCAGVADATNAYSKYLDVEMKKQKARNDAGENTQRGVRTKKRESGAGKSTFAWDDEFCWPTTESGLRDYYNIARTKNTRESRDNPTQIVVTKGPDGYSAIVEENAGSVGSSLFGVNTRGHMEYRNTSKVHKPLYPPPNALLPRHLFVSSKKDGVQEIDTLLANMVVNMHRRKSHKYVPSKELLGSMKKKGFVQKVYCIKPCSHVPADLISHSRSVVSENALELSADGQSCIVMSAMNANKIRLQLLRCLDDDKPPGHPFRGPDNGRVMEKVQEVLNMHLVQDGHHVATSDGKRTASFLLDTYSGGNEAQWNAEKFGLTNTHTGRASCLIRTDEVASAGIISCVVTILMYPVLPHDMFLADEKTRVPISNTPCADMRVVVGCVVSMFINPTLHYKQQAQTLLKWMPMTPVMTHTDPSEVSLKKSAGVQANDRPWWNATKPE